MDHIVRQGDLVEHNGRRGTVYLCEFSHDADGEEGFADVFIRWVNGDASKVNEGDFYSTNQEVPKGFFLTLLHKALDKLGVSYEYETKYEDVYEYKVITPKCFINVYLHDKAYGGSEEGGWWFHTHEPVDENCLRFATEEEAETALEKAEEEAEQDNSERRSNIGSVLSEGRFEVRLEAWPAEFSPKQRPHYC